MALLVNRISDVEMEVGDFSWSLTDTPDGEVWFATHDGETVASVARCVAPDHRWKWDVAVDVIPGSDGGERGILGNGDYQPNQERALTRASENARGVVIKARARWHLKTNPRDAEQVSMELRGVCGDAEIIGGIVSQSGGVLWWAGDVSGSEELRSTAIEKVIRNVTLPSRGAPREPECAEVDLEQLGRTREALSWIEEPEGGEDQSGGCCTVEEAEAAAAAKRIAGDLIATDPRLSKLIKQRAYSNAKVTIDGKEVPVSNLSVIHETGGSRVPPRAIYGVALNSAKPGEMLAVATHGTALVPASLPQHQNARYVSHDFAIDQQGSVRITAKHRGPLGDPTPYITIEELKQHGYVDLAQGPRGSFDELVRREEALASRELVKAVLRDKLASMPSRYLRAAEEAIDKIPLSEPDRMPRVIEAGPKGPFLENQVGGAAYEQMMAEVDKQMTKLVLGGGEDPSDGEP